MKDTSPENDVQPYLVRDVDDDEWCTIFYDVVWTLIDVFSSKVSVICCFYGRYSAYKSFKKISLGQNMQTLSKCKVQIYLHV